MKFVDYSVVISSHRHPLIHVLTQEFASTSLGAKGTKHTCAFRTKEQTHNTWRQDPDLQKRKEWSTKEFSVKSTARRKWDEEEKNCGSGISTKAGALSLKRLCTKKRHRYLSRMSAERRMQGRVGLLAKWMFCEDLKPTRLTSQV